MRKNKRKNFWLNCLNCRGLSFNSDKIAMLYYDEISEKFLKVLIIIQAEGLRTLRLKILICRLFPISLMNFVGRVKDRDLEPMYLRTYTI